jgi:hypothetical protein
MKNLKVQNVYNNGRNVPNQFEIYYENDNKHYKIFQSYNSMILKYENGILVEIGENWDYSRTTGKYRNLISGMKKNIFEKMLNNLFYWNEKTKTYIRK